MHLRRPDGNNFAVAFAKVYSVPCFYVYISATDAVPGRFRGLLKALRPAKRDAGTRGVPGQVWRPLGLSVRRLWRFFKVVSSCFLLLGLPAWGSLVKGVVGPNWGDPIPFFCYMTVCGSVIALISYTDGLRASEVCPGLTAPEHVLQAHSS